MTDARVLVAALRQKAKLFARLEGEGANETYILLTEAADALEATLPTRLLRECAICGEKVPMSHATEAWEERHKHTGPGDLLGPDTGEHVPEEPSEADVQQYYALTEVLKPHKMTEHTAGDGYTQPREAWATCKCGAHLWEWQEHYAETDEEPEEAFRAHLAAMAVNAGFRRPEPVTPETVTEWGLREDKFGGITTWGFHKHPLPENYPGYTIVTRACGPWLPVAQEEGK